jgi:phosphoribosylformylglycinamidine cyclo-ligase
MMNSILQVLQLSAERVKAGDVLIGMPASGFHANGYSLIRHIIKTKNLSLDSNFPDTSKTLGEVLLTPTEIYTLDCLALIKSLGTNLRTFVHVTGGGLAENTARVVPAGLCATYDRSTWALPAEMLFMAKAGDVAQPALERTWNAGVGMVAVVAPEVADLTLRSLAARGMKAWIAGEVRSNGAESRSTLEGTYQAR